MAPRAHWKGFLKLSLVSCPIALYPAISAAEKISFRQVNRDTGNRRWVVDLDRRTAINAGIAGARSGDVVLIAGKGHEDYQDANGVRTHFSDIEVAAAALARRNAG